MADAIIVELMGRDRHLRNALDRAEDTVVDFGDDVESVLTDVFNFDPNLGTFKALKGSFKSLIDVLQETGLVQSETLLRLSRDLGLATGSAHKLDDALDDVDMSRGAESDLERLEKSTKSLESEVQVLSP